MGEKLKSECRSWVVETGMRREGKKGGWGGGKEGGLGKGGGGYFWWGEARKMTVS